MFGKRKPSDPLGQTMLRWPSGDQYTIADLLRGLAVFGSTGSGKSSASALAMARAILGTNAGGLVLCSKPEDCPWWLERLAEAGRSTDAIVFNEEGGERCNFLAFEAESGKKAAVARDLTNLVMTVSEVLDGDKGGEKQQAFWQNLNKRIVFQTIVPLLSAYGTADGPAMREFIDTAATSPTQLNDPNFRGEFHNRTLELANERCGQGIESHDLAQANAYWPGEFCKMDERTRSSGLLGVNNCLHVFNSGLVRELCSKNSTFTPKRLNDGAWVICDFPVSTYGETGKFIMAGLKYITQRHILRRVFTPGEPPIVIVADEAQNVVNTGDSRFVLECRSHGGCLFYLSQSISNYTQILGKDSANMLIGQMAYKIFHVVDPETAQWASSLVGSCMQETYGGSQQAPRAGDTMSEALGIGEWTGSVNQGVRPILEPRAFMIGRTGGHINNLLVDSYVVRNGVPFRGDRSAIRCVWSQK